MRKVLLITPHFPPDSTAATHRVRLLAPHLEQYGWQPTVLTVDPSGYEGELDKELADWTAPSVRVVRARAWSPRLTRMVGIGDLGLRSFWGLHRAASALLRAERFDAIFITIFPAYTALLGRMLSRRFNVPFVLDYQDPWVNAWGKSVGGGVNGRVDLKSRASRALAEWLEPFAVRQARAITAVSAGTYEPILARNPAIRPITEAIPIGAEPADFVDRRREHSSPAPFDARDGRVHVCYIGTILPLGFETLRALLSAVRLVRDRRPDLYGRLRLHFFGTTNQSMATTELRVLPLARETGIGDVVTEEPSRVPYSTAVRIQQAASALLALGSSEPHYTASKIYPMLLAQRPLLAVYHEKSSGADALRRVAHPPSVRLIVYSDEQRAESKVEEIYAGLVGLIEQPRWSDADVDAGARREFFASTLAGRFATVFDRVIDRQVA